MKTNLAPMLTGKGSDLIFKSPQLTHFDAELVKKEQIHVIGEVPLIFIRLKMCVMATQISRSKAFAQNESGIRAVASPAVRRRGPNADDAESRVIEPCHLPAPQSYHVIVTEL